MDEKRNELGQFKEGHVLSDSHKKAMVEGKQRAKNQQESGLLRDNLLA